MASGGEGKKFRFYGRFRDKRKAVNKEREEQRKGKDAFIIEPHKHVYDVVTLRRK